MSVQINELEVTVDPAPAAGGSTAGSAPALPAAAELLRASLVSLRAAEQQARWAAHDRDDER